MTTPKPDDVLEDAGLDADHLRDIGVTIVYGELVYKAVPQLVEITIPEGV